MNLTQVVVLANKELIKWELDDKGWSFAFNQAQTFAGQCRPKGKTIEISKPIAEVSTEEFILDTIRHEIAHALAGCHNQHNHVWKTWARKVGATPKATYKHDDAQQALRMSKVKWVMCFQRKIVSTYLRKPNKRTIASLAGRYAIGHKELTLGKLCIEAYNPKLHVEYLNAKV